MIRANAQADFADDAESARRTGNVFLGVGAALLGGSMLALVSSRN